MTTIHDVCESYKRDLKSINKISNRYERALHKILYKLDHILFVGIQTGKAYEKQQTIQKICSFTQPTLNDYTYCNGKSYDEVMFLLYRRLRNGN